MDWEECLDKASDAVKDNIIEPEQLDAYAKYLFEKYNGDKNGSERTQQKR